MSFSWACAFQKTRHDVELPFGIGVERRRYLIVAEDSGRAVVVARHLALFGHGLHERLGELEDVALDQRFDDLEQLLDDDGDALVAEQGRDGAEVGRADKGRVLLVDAGVGDVERFAAPQVVVVHRRRLVAQHRLREEQVAALDEAARGRVVAVVGQKVVVELPKDVQRHAAVRRQHVVVGLAPHVVKVVQRQPSAQQLVRQPVHLQQALPT